MTRGSAIASLALFVVLLFAGWLAVRRPSALPLTPGLSGEVEYCLTCHADLPEISESHPIESFGCVICHGGERLALDEELAHSTMRGGRNPSDFRVVEASCGGTDCHSGAKETGRDHIQRALRNVQGTYAGAIANIRFTFGVQADQDAHQGIYPVENPEYHPGDAGAPRLSAFDPAQESHPKILEFAANCLYCHLSASAPTAAAFLPVSTTNSPSTHAVLGSIPPEFARLTGCAACHTPSAGTDLASQLHRLTTSISYTQCNTCHNRGNYDLRSMQFIPRSDHPTSRLEDYYQPIAQFVRCEWTLDCIDCHTRAEAMGDGTIPNNKAEAQYIRCFTCHGTLDELPKSVVIQNPDDLALRLAFLNPVIDLQIGDEVLVTDKGEPLWNTRLLSNGEYELVGKATGQHFTFRAVKGSGCRQNIEEQESRSCHACHAVER